jgi:hypothetical protein
MPSAISIVRSLCPQVKRVVDAKRDITVEITKRDASVGQSKDHRKCVVAETCKKKLKLDDAIVAVRRAYLIRGDTAVRYSVPEAVSRELISFDRGGSFAPGMYKLKAPPKIKPRGTGTRHQGDPRPGQLRHRRHETQDVRAPLNAL